MTDEGIKNYLFASTSVLIILSLTTLILLIYKLIKINKSKYENNKSVRGRPKKKKLIQKRQYPTIFCAFFEFCSTCLFIFVIDELQPDSNANFSSNKKFVILIVICGVFIFLSKLSLYAQFLVRLFNTFKGSALHMNRSTMIISIILFILSIILLIWWIILILIHNVSTNPMMSDNSYYTQLVIIMVLLILINGSLCYMIVILFTRKLFRFLLFRDRSTFLRQAESKLGFQVSDAENKNLVADNSDDIDNDNEDDKKNNNRSNLPKITRMRKSYSFVLDIVGAGIDDKDMNTLDFVAKQFLLSGSSIVITTLVYLTLIFVVIRRDELSEHNYIWIYWLFGGIYYPLDVIVNCIVLYFNYKFAEKFYNCCCKFGHRKCKDCAIKHAAKKIYEQHYDELMLKNDS